VAKPTPMPEKLGTDKTDLFDDLVPVAIHQVNVLTRLCLFVSSLRFSTP
jgi:hypothetical protein